MINSKNLSIRQRLNTKKKKILCGGIVGIVIICGCVGGYILTHQYQDVLFLSTHQIDVEYGSVVSTDILDYLDKKKVDKATEKEIIKGIKCDDNLELETDKDYSKVGEYELKFSYNSEKATVKVSVKDTTPPEIIVPTNIDILQGSDLTTFDFQSLLTVHDLSGVNEMTIDYSSIDTNTPGEYLAKASIGDIYENHIDQDFKVTIITKIEIAADEVVVQEIITNEDGTTTVKNSIKKQSEASLYKVVSNSNNTITKPTVNTSSSSSSSSSHGSHASHSSSNNTSQSSSSSSASGSGSTSSESGSSSSGDSNSNSQPTKIWHYWYKCKYCGYRVESIVSLEDAYSMFMANPCPYGVINQEHTGWNYGFYEK